MIITLCARGAPLVQFHVDSAQVLQDRHAHRGAGERQREAHLKVTTCLPELTIGHAADIVNAVMHGPASRARPARRGRC